ncbi:hypothetical protein V1478_009906, partial [Vespula squamosa]
NRKDNVVKRIDLGESRVSTSLIVGVRAANGFMLTHKSAVEHNRWVKLFPMDRTTTDLPFYHCFTLVDSNSCSLNIYPTSIMFQIKTLARVTLETNSSSKARFVKRYKSSHLLSLPNLSNNNNNNNNYNNNYKNNNNNVEH